MIANAESGSKARIAVRYAAAIHAACGDVVEVVRAGEQILLLPPRAPIARRSSTGDA